MTAPACYCGSRMVLKKGRFGLFYGCEAWPQCDGAAAAHEDGRPMSRPSNKETRAARVRAHKVFDLLWKVDGWKRTEAYAWMAKAMDITKEEAHIGQLDRAQCERLIELVKGIDP